MTEQFIVGHAMLIANYTGIAMSFLVIMWCVIRPIFRTVKARFFAGYVAYYVTAVSIVRLFDWYIVYRVYSFDHDGDEVFQNHELVGDLGFFWDLMIRDTARTFHPITALFFALVGASIAYGLAFASTRLIRLIRA